MDHLALFDGLAASTSLDLSGLPAAADLDRSTPYCRDKDKGKARACDDVDDDTPFHPTISAPAECSRSGRSLSALSDNSSRLRDTRSADHSDSKGKARQLFSDAHSSASASATDSHFLRRTRTSTPTYNRQCERNASVSCSYHDEASLKRSIRQMGSSPSSSPRQNPRPLPSAQAGGSTSQLGLDLIASDEPSCSLLSAASASAQAQRPGTPNKKRRPFRSGDDNENDTFTIRSDQHAPRTHVVETLPADTTLRSEGHSRRASLLLNSSTRDSQSFESNPTLCVSPEPFDGLPRSEQASSELSHRRTAFLASARAQRSSSSIRRRRGFYLRDADLLRNDPSEESLVASSDRPNSSASDTFMAEFARAVDLRLAARSDSNQAGAFTSSSARTPHTHHQQAPRTDTPQPSAPQLPYPRTASPLTISFAAVEADQLRQEAQRGLTARPTSRRRIPVPTHAASLQADQDGSSSTVTSRRFLHDQAYWQSSPTYQLDETSSVAAPSDHQIFSRYASTQRESRSWRVESRQVDTDASTAVATDSERIDARRPYQVGLSAHSPLESHTRNESAADDFGAVQRPFGLRGTRLSRRPYRSRAEDTFEAGPSATAEAERLHHAHSRRDADDATDRQADAERERRDSPPPSWRRAHSGLLFRSLDKGDVTRSEEKTLT